MDNYKALIAGLVPILKTLGYSKSGESFYYNHEGNIGIINFQKSKSSTSNSTLFTINLGVYSAALKIFDNFEIKSKPTISDCHWRKRIGFLLPDMQDYWWEINNSISLTELETDIALILNEHAIPEIEKYITNERLEKSWMDGNSDGLTEQQMDLYLIALLKEHNSSALQSKITELKEKVKGKPFYNNIKENLIKLGITDV
jgi:hypothetical protein